MKEYTTIPTEDLVYWMKDHCLNWRERIENGTK